MVESIRKPIITKKIIDMITDWSILRDESKILKNTLIIDIHLSNDNISYDLELEIENIKKGTDPKIITIQNKVSKAFDDIVIETGTVDENNINLLKKLAYLKIKIDRKNYIIRKNKLLGGTPDTTNLKKEFNDMIPSISEIFVWDNKNKELEEFFCVD